MKVYDCFPFFNELDLLEVRLNELNDYVDYFIIAEASKTHSNIPKPLYFYESKERFSKFLPKIRHIIVENLPDCRDDWVREKFQSNQLLRGLVDCENDDLIILTDADEIPNVKTLKQIQIDPAASHNLIMDSFLYFLNYTTSNNWRSGKLLTWGLAKQYKEFTDIRTTNGTVDVANAGWHFSYLGGVERVNTKIKSFAHQEFNNEKFTNDQHLRAYVNSGFTIWFENIEDDHPGIAKFLPINCDLLPDFVKNNQSKLRHLLKDVNFSNDPYPLGKLVLLQRLLNSVNDLDGDIVDVGCLDGRSTIHIANIGYPQNIYAVDVSDQFNQNIKELTSGNIKTSEPKGLVKFVHIRSNLENLKRFKVVDGGIICGLGATENSDLLKSEFPDCHFSQDFWWTKI